jgi:hypothetical protein
MKQKTLYIILTVSFVIVIVLGTALILKQSNITQREYKKNKETYEKIKLQNDSLNILRENLEKEFKELQSRSIN